MSFLALRLLALSSVAALAVPGATRPRYGGALEIATPALPDLRASHLVVERLVRIDDAGYATGWLAQGWQHDADFKTWRLTLRPNVRFHDGSPVTAGAVAAVLSASLQLDCSVSGETLVIRSATAAPGLLARLAAPDAAIFRQSDAGALIGTGPFRVESSDERRVVLTAFEDYWGGRPYLDRVEFSTGIRPTYQPAAADVWRLPVNISGRAVAEPMRIWSSEPRELIALSMDGAPPPVREALALSIDRDSIVNVLTQRRGEAAYSLLPGWLSGYAFLFHSPADPARAREIGATLHNAPLEIAAPENDALARLVAERIIVNARDAGLVVRLANQGAASTAPLRVVRARIAWNDPRRAVAVLAWQLGLPVQTAPATLEDAWRMERDQLADRRILPVVFVPDVYAIAPRVRNWSEAQKRRDGLLHLEDVWVEP